MHTQESLTGLTSSQLTVAEPSTASPHATLKQQPLRNHRREYEVLLRKVLGFEKRPAVIALYWFSRHGHRFYDNGQDDMDILARRASRPA